MEVVIVPGYTPPWAKEPVLLHPIARARVRAAVRRARAFRIGPILLTGGAVYPPGTPWVEAEEMACFLRSLGWPSEQVHVEAKARHTTTNVRNAGRIMLDRGWSEGLISTDPFQGFYLGSPRSPFRWRYRRELGHDPGRLERLGLSTIRFTPSAGVRAPGPDPIDP